MINNFQLLQNIGCFDSATSATNLLLARLSLIYAENGRGKTTLAAILRSLATGESIPIMERSRLAAQHPPHVVVSCTGGLPDAVFQNGSWNCTFPDIAIFDDVFVSENVHSGLVVSSDHRQNLHELILGVRGVTLNRQLRTLIKQIEVHNSKLRQHSDAIPADQRRDLSVDDFCALPQSANVDQEIQSAEQNLAASKQQDVIRNQPDLQKLNLPEIDLDEIERILLMNLPGLDAVAVARVQQHFDSIGDGSEAWVADGVHRQKNRSGSAANECVFCAQDISASPMITHYRAFFSDAYRDLQQHINRTITDFGQAHSEQSILQFEREARFLVENRRFWAQFEQLPDISIDTTTITSNWTTARNQVTQLLAQKQASHLDQIQISDDVRGAVESYRVHCREIATLNQQLVMVNQTIATVKQRASTANSTEIESTLRQLKATKARHTQTTDALCRAYLSEKTAKEKTEQQRDQARRNLDQYRTNVFPAYQILINKYLQKFNTGYYLDSVQAANTRGGPTCTYNIVVNNTPVAVAGGTPQPGQHSFRNVLSAGDRNALALAFFLASLELDPNRANKIVVIDDPVSSLDEHRSLTTVQETRHLATQVCQVIVLSHSKPFLCRIWENADPTIRAALQVVRSGSGSMIQSWNVTSDSITENDRRHAMLTDYLMNGGQNEREIAQAIRPQLEAFIRVSYPKNFPPSTLLGAFINVCRQRVGPPPEVLSQADIDELNNIVDYANRFHHGTNPNWATETINHTELEGFVERTLAFTKRP